MVRWLYRWLPVVFGCHCRADRSFFWSGKKFPICARCTGELVGMLFAAGLYALMHCPVLVCALLMVPLLIDGFAQKLTGYESTNFRRFVTGFLFGIGFMTILLDIAVFSVKTGYQFGLTIRMKSGWTA